jgi:hypothetical protein
MYKVVKRQNKLYRFILQKNIKTRHNMIFKDHHINK